MFTKKNFFSLAAAVLLFITAFAAGCSKDPVSSESSSLPDSSETSSLAFVPAPQADLSGVVYTPVPGPGEDKTITITDALRAQYFEYFAQGYSEMMPKTDFDAPENIDANFAVKQALAMTKPFSAVNTDHYVGLYIYDLLELQASIYKYFGYQLETFDEVVHPTVSLMELRVYSETPLPFYVEYYYLTGLSVTAEGVYTAQFDKYRGFGGELKNYESMYAKAKTDILTKGKSQTDFEFVGTAELKYVEMTDSSGDVFYRFLSKTSTDAQ